jgi:hypothetical protein
MLRGLVILLLLANFAFFAWTQGWLDTVVGTRAIGDREPERMARQVRPELVRILPAGSGSDATPAAAALACLEAGPISEANLAAAQAAAQAALPSGSWSVARTEQPGTWIIYLGRFANAEALSKKVDEIKRRKLPYEEVRGNAALEPGLSIGRFEDRAAADKALEQFAQQGVRTARVVELNPAATRIWLRIEKADAALASKVSAMKADAFGSAFVACTKAPGN